MKEIKYRAKVQNSNNWIYRQPFHIRGTWYMYNSLWDMVLIEHKTISQYTGLKDKNGVEIYEGDIVRFVDFDTTGAHRDDREHTGIVKYQSGIYEIWKSNDSEYHGSDGAFILNHVWLQDDEFELIGNKFDHPHLLEVAQ